MLAVRGAIRLGRQAGRADGAFSALRDVVHSLRLKHSHTYKQSAARDVIRRLVPSDSPHAAVVLSLCKDSARMFLASAEQISDDAAGALYDGLVNDGTPVVTAEQDGDGTVGLFFVDAMGDSVADDSSKANDSGDDDDEDDDEEEEEESENDDDTGDGNESRKTRRADMASAASAGGVDDDDVNEHGDEADDSDHDDDATGNSSARSPLSKLTASIAASPTRVSYDKASSGKTVSTRASARRDGRKRRSSRSANDSDEGAESAVAAAESSRRHKRPKGKAPQGKMWDAETGTWVDK